MAFQRTPSWTKSLPVAYANWRADMLTEIEKVRVDDLEAASEELKEPEGCTENFKIGFTHVFNETLDPPQPHSRQPGNQNPRRDRPALRGHGTAGNSLAQKKARVLSTLPVVARSQSQEHPDEAGD